MAGSQTNVSTLLLGLAGYEVGEVMEEEKGIAVEVQLESRRQAWPRCDSVELYRHGRAKKRKVIHGWIQGRRVYIEIARHRWRYRDCRHSFTEGAELVRPHSRLSKQAEAEALWQTRHLSLSQVKKELGISYSTMQRLLEREIDGDIRGFIEEELFLGIDEHSFRHQNMVYTVMEVKKRKMLGGLRDDQIDTLKAFLKKIPQGKVREECIDMKESLRKVVEEIFPETKVVVDHFHVIADSNKRMDEARRIE